MKDSLPATWRTDLDALQFDLPEGLGQCLVHRLAFRSLLAETPTPEACQAYFRSHWRAFEAAARAKVEEKSLAPGARFHLTSRDVARAAGLPGEAGAAEDQPSLD